jgi:predicted RNase H-like nuclease
VTNRSRRAPAPAKPLDQVVPAGDPLWDDVDTPDLDGPSVPLGVPLTGPRQADVLSRGLVGKRKSSVFPTPIRASLLATSHADGSALNLRATGKGITRQAYGLGKKILEIDAWVRTVDCAVIEVHPEVCFATLAGRPLAHPKWSWAGAEERRRLLASAGIQVPADIGVAGESASVDDVLDAAAASWTARRYAEGSATCHPETPEQFDDGPSAAIWAWRICRRPASAKTTT